MAGRIGCRIPFPHGCGLLAQTGRAPLAEQDWIGFQEDTTTMVLTNYLLFFIAWVVLLIYANRCED